MAYAYLFVAIVAEVVGTTALKASEEFTKFKQIPDVPAIIGMSLIVAGVVVMHLFSKTIGHVS